MKYLFKDLPDEHGDGFIRKYIDAVSKTNPKNQFRLEIDYDLCAPLETWTLKLNYVAVTNGVEHGSSFNQQVYLGKSLTPEQVDMMVELVMEHEYLEFGEFINQ